MALIIAELQFSRISVRDIITVFEVDHVMHIIGISLRLNIPLERDFYDSKRHRRRLHASIRLYHTLYYARTYDNDDPLTQNSIHTFYFFTIFIYGSTSLVAYGSVKNFDYNGVNNYNDKKEKNKIQ